MTTDGLTNDTHFDPANPELPDQLDFCFPLERIAELSVQQYTTLHHDSDVKLYRQLVCWCIVQRYRYYVLNEPEAHDALYDFIEAEIKRMESQCDYLHNRYSPSRCVGSTRREDYPAFVRWMFNPGD
jgi:hypothetical protein